jgi:hypothetical protein
MELPALFQHFQYLGVSLDLFLIDWYAPPLPLFFVSLGSYPHRCSSLIAFPPNRAIALFAKTLPLDVVTRIWDIFLLEGEISVIRVGLGMCIVCLIYSFNHIFLNLSMGAAIVIVIIRLAQILSETSPASFIRGLFADSSACGPGT